MNKSCKNLQKQHKTKQIRGDQKCAAGGSEIKGPQVFSGRISYDYQTG